MRRRNQKREYGTPYQDPAGSEMHEEADDPDGFNRWYRKKQQSIAPRSRWSIRPARVATGYGARLKRRFG